MSSLFWHNLSACVVSLSFHDCKDDLSQGIDDVD